MPGNLKNKGTIILAFRNEVISDVYALAFEGIFGAQIIACTDAAAASYALRKNPEACVIIESAIAGGPLNAFFECQAALAKRANVFVLGGDRSLVPAHSDKLRVEFLLEHPEMRDVVANVEAALKLEGDAQEFCKITLKGLLIRSEKLRCDVYLKLSGDKFVKVLHANDRFDKEDHDRFLAKNVEFLYLPRADFFDFMDDLLSRVADLNRAPETLAMDVAVTATEAIFQTVHAAVETDGFTPRLQQLAVASVDLAINTIKRNPRLSELLARFDMNRDSYISWHSTAMSFLSCKLAAMLGWHSEATFLKLSLASILHDLTLTSDQLAKIRTPAQLNAAVLADRDRAAVLRHPIEAAQLVASFDEIPGEVGFIVEQHHEWQDGTGFPRGINHKDISAISALFIISLDIVTTMYDAPPENFQMAEFLAAREAEGCYTTGAFGQVFRALLAKDLELSSETDTT
jgi:hypothetical protein